MRQDLPEALVRDISDWCDHFPKVCDDLEGLFGNNRIFKQRNVDIGVVSLEDAWKWGFSGVMVRGSGAAWDLRKAQPYECYEELEFDIPIGKNRNSRSWRNVPRRTSASRASAATRFTWCVAASTGKIACVIGCAVQTLGAIEHLDTHVTTHQGTYEDGLLALPIEEMERIAMRAGDYTKPEHHRKMQEIYRTMKDAVMAKG